MPIPPCPEGVYEIQSGPWRAWFTPFGARMIQLWHYKRPLMLGLANPEDYKRTQRLWALYAVVMAIVLPVASFHVTDVTGS